MKKLMMFLIGLTYLQTAFTQNFQEICNNSITNGTIVNFEEYGDTLYSTGFFNTICGKSAQYIAKWQNNEWQPSSLSISDPGHVLKTINGQLYIAKYEESIDSNWVLFYDGNTINKLGEGVYLTTASGFSELPNIYDIIEYNGKIIACGEFDRVGNQTINGIMEWNGNQWDSLGSGLTDNIQNTAPVIFPHQMMVYNNELYVAGNFKNAGGIQVNGIAKWDGSSWSKMGDGFNGTVYSMAVYNGEIIVGGSFTASGNTSLNRIAKWDGTAWTSLNFGFTSTSPNDFIFVHTLKEIDSVLYIGGGLKEITFSDNSTLPCGGIVTFDGQQVYNFNGGIANNDIEAITKINTSDLLVGGGVFGNGYTGIFNLNTNTSHIKSSQEVQIFPNPFHDIINITSIHSFETYSLIDITGKTVLSGDFKEQINLEHISNGIYILQLRHLNEVANFKIIRH